MEPGHPHDAGRGHAPRMAATERLLVLFKGSSRTAAAADVAEAAAAGPGELGRSEHYKVPARCDAGQDQCGPAGDQDALVEV